MTAAALEEEGLRPGMVSVVQTFGEAARFHPCPCPLCQGRMECRRAISAGAYLDHRMAEELFRHHVLRLPKAQGLLSHERAVLRRQKLERYPGCPRQVRRCATARPGYDSCFSAAAGARAFTGAFA